MTKRTLKIMPKTQLGWWSIGLILAMLILFIAGTSLSSSMYQSLPAGDTVLEDIIARPALALTMLFGMLAGISALITGLLSIIKQKESALLVYLSSLIGALVLIFIIGMLIFPD
jgi:hypothetical protein